jgi:hypothetical protein
MKTLLFLFLTLTFWTNISRSAEDRSNLLSVDIKVKKGPAGARPDGARIDLATRSMLQPAEEPKTLANPPA